MKMQPGSSPLKTSKPFKCPQCDATFRLQCYIKSHMAHVHSKEKPFRCGDCDKSFKTVNALKIHKAHVHPKEGGAKIRSFKCEHCPRTFYNRGGLNHHSRNVHPCDKPFKCDLFCDQAFPTIARRDEHMRYTHLKEKVHICKHPNCVGKEKAFSTAYFLRMHELTHTKKEERLKHNCPQCDKKFFNRTSLVQHCRLHTGQVFTCEIEGCGKSFTSKPKLKDHVGSHSAERPFTCPHCDSKFRQAGNFKRHVRTRHGEDAVARKYKCSICHKGFGAKTTRDNHEKTHLSSSERERFHCPHCSKVYINKTALQIHLRQFHSGQEREALVPCPYPNCSTLKKLFAKHRLQKHIYRQHKGEEKTCQFCEKKFKTMERLNVHLKRHSGQRPFKCGEKGCDMNFVTKADLTKHKGNRHTDPALRKKFPCLKCDTWFVSNSYLKMHENTKHKGKSSGFICAICSRNLNSKASLYEHILTIHTKEKPFKCTFCSAFECSNRNKLRRHVRVMHNDKIPICYFCKKSTPCERSLWIHLTTHTNERMFQCGICVKRFRYCQRKNTHMMKNH